MSRSPSGELLADPDRFPGGLKAVADYVHSKGLKLGTYLDIGTTTCGGFPGFNVSALDDQGPEPQYVKDIKALAAAGIDSLKVDGCNADPRVMNITYPKLGDALNATGRPILYSCSWPDYVRSSFGNGAVREFSCDCGERPPLPFASHWLGARRVRSAQEVLQRLAQFQRHRRGVRLRARDHHLLGE